MTAQLAKLEWYIEKEYLSVTTLYATLTYPYVTKWLNDDDILHEWSNFFQGTSNKPHTSKSLEPSVSDMANI